MSLFHMVKYQVIKFDFGDAVVSNFARVCLFELRIK